MNKYDARAKLRTLETIAKEVNEPALTIVYELLEHLCQGLEETSERSRYAFDATHPQGYGR